MKNSTKTLLFTIAACAISILVSGYTQMTGQGEVGDRASYLDPFLVDILAFAVAIFLVIEGAIRIWMNKDAEWTEFEAIAFDTVLTIKAGGKQVFKGAIHKERGFLGFVIDPESAIAVKDVVWHRPGR